MAKRKTTPRHLYKTTQPYTLFSPLYEPLGAFAVAFAHLESGMTSALVELLRVTPQQALAIETLMQNLYGTNQTKQEQADADRKVREAIAALSNLKIKPSQADRYVNSNFGMGL